jgi:hypothetical protein
MHDLNRRVKYDLHMPNSNLTKYQKWVYCSGIRSFSNLPTTIKNINHNVKILKPALKECLLSHHFYCVDEFTLIENF